MHEAKINKNFFSLLNSIFSNSKAYDACMLAYTTEHTPTFKFSYKSG